MNLARRLALLVKVCPRAKRRIFEGERMVVNFDSVAIKIVEFAIAFEFVVFVIIETIRRIKRM